MCVGGWWWWGAALGNYQRDDGTLRRELSGAEQRPDEAINLPLLGVVLLRVRRHLRLLPEGDGPGRKSRELLTHLRPEPESYRERVKLLIKYVHQHPSISVPDGRKDIWVLLTGQMTDKNTRNNNRVCVCASCVC